jgi:hypothetical protein
LLSHTPTGQEQIPHDEAHGRCCDEFVRGLGRRLPINSRLLDRCCHMMYLFIYLFCTELLLYSKYVTFVSEPRFIICVRLGPITPGDYFVPGSWCPRNLGVTWEGRTMIFSAIETNEGARRRRRALWAEGGKGV